MNYSCKLQKTSQCFGKETQTRRKSKKGNILNLDERVKKLQEQNLMTQVNNQATRGPSKTNHLTSLWEQPSSSPGLAMKPYS